MAVGRGRGGDGVVSESGARPKPKARARRSHAHVTPRLRRHVTCRHNHSTVTEARDLQAYFCDTLSLSRVAYGICHHTYHAIHAMGMAMLMALAW